MNTNSPYTTAAITLTATQITPLVGWALTGFHATMPDTVPGIIAAAIVMVVHGIGNVIANKITPSSSNPPSQKESS